jgi:hypothetical protein
MLAWGFKDLNILEKVLATFSLAWAALAIDIFVRGHTKN